MNHNEIKELLYDYTKNECAEKSDEIKAHLATCAECRDEIKKLNSIKSLFRGSIVALPSTVRSPYAGGFLPAFLRPVPAFIAAALLVLVVLSGINIKSYTERQAAVSFVSDSYSYFLQETQTDLLANELTNY
jgi:hypothetical protein